LRAAVASVSRWRSRPTLRPRPQACRPRPVRRPIARRPRLRRQRARSPGRLGAAEDDHRLAVGALPPRSWGASVKAEARLGSSVCAACGGWLRV
jgi:hypothetical protein